MAKTRTAYLCSSCGAHSVKWQGQCAECGDWNTLSEVRLATGSGAGDAGGVTDLAALAELSRLGGDERERTATGFGEFDRVLGGGLVPGAVTLLGGDPGVGKSTLLLQVAARLRDSLPVLYVSGEESLRQVAQRARRLGVADSDLHLLAETRLDVMLDAVTRSRAEVLVVDSMQTITSGQLDSAAGSVSQLRECVARLVRLAKERDVAVFIVGHVTKEGAIAGPRMVEHMVDTVLYFESDPASRFSMVRAVKNRFGAVNEIGMFAMGPEGFREVKNPSAIFLSRDTAQTAGGVVTVAWEGSRSMLVEVQALVTEGAGGYPRRLSQGQDQNRLNLLLAVLQRHGGLSLAGDDVFVNVVGGIRIAETAADLPTVLAVVSSLRDRVVDRRTVSFGEIGLAGEVRPVRYGEERLAEAAKQGFRRAIVPRANAPRRPLEGMETVPVSRLSEALEAAFG
ncbi:MAG TPA: DNA repair protein RadA [Woeseiaceae bacterium]|nr:DNA repair protein RadA [Woeseiaceae bacterium]